MEECRTHDPEVVSSNLTLATILLVLLSEHYWYNQKLDAVEGVIDLERL